MSSTRLDVVGIAATADRLVGRVDDRFSGRGLSDVAHDLAATAHSTAARLARLRRPRWWLRGCVIAIVVLALALLIAAIASERSGTTIDGADEWLSTAESAFQDLVFAGAAALFLFSIEGRLRRREALADLHQLRSLAHVIDMHQLTKDPETLSEAYRPTASSPERTMSGADLSRYLDYCSEMLALTSKLAALYSQEIRDPVVLDAVREVQDLTIGLSSKIWQKLTILDRPR